MRKLLDFLQELLYILLIGAFLLASLLAIGWLAIHTRG